MIAPIAVGNGVSTAQRSIARGQRVRNTQPLTVSSGDGGSAVGMALRLRRARARLGVLASRACVYGWSGRAKIASFGPCSTALPRYMTTHGIGNVADDLQVMRDEQVRDGQFLLQIEQQVQHLRLDRHVECGDRFIGDDQSRIEHQRTRHGDALALTAGKHVRIPPVVLAAQSDLGHDRQRLFAPLGRRAAAVNQQWFFEQARPRCDAD